MKTTINVNIGSIAFTVDEDAYEALKRYLDAIARNLGKEQSETLQEVECRIAEMLRERIPSPMHVVTIEDVAQVRSRLGNPADFAPDGREVYEEQEPHTHHRPRISRLYRSRINRSIAGVCGGLADFFEIDATLCRMVTLFLILFGGISLWVYIILWIVLPDEPLENLKNNYHYGRR